MGVLHSRQGFFGDGGLATNARLNSPEGVGVSQTGGIYIADTTNCRARKANAVTSIITTYGGTGTCGYALPTPPSDGIPATNARLNSPREVILDATGNVYIADTSNCRIRRVDAVTGFISTFAGTGNCNLSGDGGLATNARINSPRGLAFDTAGDIYIADRSNRRIRRVDSATGIITTHAGTGIAGNTGDDGEATSARLNTPRRVLAYDDVDGHLMIADTANN